MKKRIAHIINSNIYSGLENVVCTIMHQLQDEFEMIYVTQDGPIIKVLEEKGIPYFVIKKMSINEIKKFILKWSPDVLHAHDYTASVICALSNSQLPIINHLHNNSPWLKKMGINSFAYLYAGLKANNILTVSDSVGKEFIFSKFIKNKIKVVGNPVSRKNILNNINQGQYTKKYDICCVGRLTRQKNPMRFIRIVEILVKTYPQIKVVWVGDGELKSDILKEVKKIKLEENISFVGFQKNPYIYMVQSKFFMLTSAWEGYGLVAFEALTLGLPAVVSNVGGLVDVVDDKCGLLCETDEDFIREIDRLLTSNCYLEDKSLKAVEKSKSLENITEYMSTLGGIYEIF